MQEKIEKDIMHWLYIGWEYRIIHKMAKVKYDYDVSKEEISFLKKELFKLTTGSPLTFLK